VSTTSTAEQLTRGWAEQPARLFLEAVSSGSLIGIRRALAAIEAGAVPSPAPEIKLNLLASFNVESILPMLQLPLRAIPCRPAFEIAPFNTVERQLMDHHGMAYARGVFANVVLWRLEDVFPEVFFPCCQNGRALSERLGVLKERITGIVEDYAVHCPTPLFLSTFPMPEAISAPVFASQQDPGVFSALACLNAEIYRLAANHERTRVLDLFYWSAQLGAERCYDLQMDFYARQPFRPQAACSLGLHLARTLKPLLAPPKKALAVDLDDTLWGGLLGEDGVGGLEIGNDFPGNVFLRIQREILELKHKGVLLVLLSKNTESDAQKALEEIPDMVLKWNDFACRMVDFNHKYLNLRAAAGTLGIGTDSFALLDDSNYEREQMRAFNPEVLVLNQDDDPVHMLRAMVTTDAFDRHRLSEEDRNRSHEYQLRGARSVEGRKDRLQEFLASLQLKARVETIGEQNLERVVQMLGKTNQFNLTTRRHRHDQLRAMVGTAGAIGLALRLRDKFGDQGIVGVLLAVPDGSAEVLRVDSLLVSCRALGRGVEEALWAVLLRKAAHNGAKRLYAEYIPTPKNGLAADFYNKLGLTIERQNSAAVLYKLDPLAVTPEPAWMEIEAPEP
jgi:FkbH-like protein